MKKNFLSNPALTIVLAIMLPLVFFFAQNGYGLFPKAMVIALGFMLLFALFWGGVTLFIYRKFKKNFSELPIVVQKSILFLFCAIVIGILYFELEFQYSYWLFTHKKYQAFLYFFLPPFAVIFCVAFKSGFRIINTFFLIFLVVSSVNIAGYLTSDEAVIKKTFPPHYALKKRPNIYLFYQESLNSLNIQKEVYGIDTSDIKSYLTDNNFFTYDNVKVYSNSPNTLNSLTDTFIFSSSWSLSRGNADITYAARSIISGSKENVLFKILKENGYKTIRLLNEGGTYTGYYGTIKGEYLDQAKNTFTSPLWQDYLTALRYIGVLNQYIAKRINSILYFLDKNYMDEPLSLEEDVAEMLKQQKLSEQPLFSFFKGGAKHADPFFYHYSPEALASWIKKYSKLVEEGNKRLKTICDMIIKEDPGALIIVIGDHGAWRMYGAEGDAKTLAEVKANVEKQGISWKDFCEDRFSVLLSIRLPYGEKKDISQGLNMAHVNLFRHIFSYLNDDKEILSTRVPSDSYWNNFKLISDGKIIENP